jgi:N-acetylglucosamine malate deacetylase 2
MLLAAHPDDECLGAAALLMTSPRVRVLHLTDGAPRDRTLWPPGLDASREGYARIRRRECLAALGKVGMDGELLVGLGAADQEGAQQLPRLIPLLWARLLLLRPPSLVVHPYEGGHPDHDAAALAAHAAVALLRARGERAPVLLEMSSYHGTHGRLVTSEFLPRPERAVRSITLSDAQRSAKREALGCFASQRPVLEQFPVATESFRLAPRYDFTQPPHPGRLYYESLGWPLAGEQWRQLARAALLSVGLATGVPL